MAVERWSVAVATREPSASAICVNRRLDRPALSFRFFAHALWRFETCPDAPLSGSEEETRGRWERSAVPLVKTDLPFRWRGGRVEKREEFFEDVAEHDVVFEQLFVDLRKARTTYTLIATARGLRSSVAP